VVPNRELIRPVTSLDSYSPKSYAAAMSLPSTAQLKRALEIKLQLESLESELHALLGSHQGHPTTNGTDKRREMSAVGRPKLNGTTVAKSGKKTRRKMSAAAKAKLSAIARKRWRKAKAAGKTAL
jgi:hypothetical protein